MAADDPARDTLLALLGDLARSREEIAQQIRTDISRLAVLDAEHATLHRLWRAQTEPDITHLVAANEPLTACCKRSPFDMGRWTERLTSDPALVTCRSFRPDLAGGE